MPREDPGRDSDDEKDPGGAGFSGPVLDRGSALMADYEQDPGPGSKGIPMQTVRYDPAWDWPPAGVKHSSRNHRANAWTVETARAAIHGTEEQFTRARAILAGTYFPQELGVGPSGIGLWGREMFSPDNHTHQQLSATSMARLAAWRSKDPLLLELSGALLRATTAALLAMASAAPDFFIGAPGLRSPGKPLWWAGTAWLRQVMRQPGPMPEFRRKPGKPDLWLDRASLGVRVIRYLQDHGDDLGGAAAVQLEDAARVKVKYPVKVWRGSDRHLAVITRRPDGDDLATGVCDWVEVRWRETFKATSADMTFGLDWTTPPPPPPRGATLIVFDTF